jgi:hypothetical protein
MLKNLFRLVERLRGQQSAEDAADRIERNRLNAEYTGTFAKNPGQEYGIMPPK